MNEQLPPIVRLLNERGMVRGEIEGICVRDGQGVSAFPIIRPEHHD